MPVLKLPRARSPVLLLGVDRRPTSAALWCVVVLVMLAFGVAFTLGTRAPQGTVGKAQGAPPARAPAAGSAMTSLRLDPVPALPSLRNEGAGRISPPPAKTAAAPPAPAAAPPTSPASPAPRPVRTPAAVQPVQPQVTPSQPAPARKPQPSPGGTPFDSSGGGTPFDSSG
jgi:hypothetical protein